MCASTCSKFSLSSFTFQYETGLFLLFKSLIFVNNVCVCVCRSALSTFGKCSCPSVLCQRCKLQEMNLSQCHVPRNHMGLFVSYVFVKHCLNSVWSVVVMQTLSSVISSFSKSRLAIYLFEKRMMKIIMSLSVNCF